MITVKVASESTGKAVKGVGVSIGFSGLLSGGVTSRVYTDSSGEAHFNVDPGEGTVYVEGNDVKKGYLSGKVVVYVYNQEKYQ